MTPLTWKRPEGTDPWGRRGDGGGPGGCPGLAEEGVGCLLTGWWRFRDQVGWRLHSAVNVLRFMSGVLQHSDGSSAALEGLAGGLREEPQQVPARRRPRAQGIFPVRASSSLGDAKSRLVTMSVYRQTHKERT